MNDIVIAEAVRSAVGRAHKGSLALRRSDELAGEVIRHGGALKVAKIRHGKIEKRVDLRPQTGGTLGSRTASPEGQHVPSYPLIR